MSNIIIGYSLSLTTEQVVRMPEGAKILSVYSEGKRVCISTLSRQGNRLAAKIIEMHPEGISIKDPLPIYDRVYIGSVVSAGIHFYVFELVAK